MSKPLFIYEATIYDIETDQTKKDFIASEIPPDLAQKVGLKREGKEIYLGRVYKIDLDKPVADLTLQTIRYD